jgi:hypothetical protein
MLASSQVSHSHCDLESDDEMLDARYMRLFQVKFDKTLVARGQKPYILHLCQELTDELALPGPLFKNRQETHGYLADLSQRIQAFLLSPEFERLKDLKCSQNNQVQILTPQVNAMIIVDRCDQSDATVPKESVPLLNHKPACRNLRSITELQA